ncbi:hypothetical protein GCM10029964_110990 [Kibdelosporangium lantanae]
MTTGPGRQAVLAAIAAYRGEPHAEVVRRVDAEVAGLPVHPASADETNVVLATVVRRLRLAPIAFEIKASVLSTLAGLGEGDLTVSKGEVAAWNTLIRERPPAIVDVDREPVVLPAMPQAQEAAWEAILDFEVDLVEPWCLVGGQMVAFYCAEYGVSRFRPTADADIVMGLWTERSALTQASRSLCARGFVEDKTFDGYGYRYRRENASVDLLLPEEVSGQRKRPVTTSGRPGVEIPGGNQALMRAERVPVRLGARLGRVRRPNMLGAIVAKSAAALADSRDAERHYDDIALLARIAFDGVITDAWRLWRRTRTAEESGTRS